MAFKIIKNSNNFFVICIICCLCLQNQSILASGEPIIKVLISKNKNLRIRSDRSIPLTISGKNLPFKKIKGLNLKKVNNKTILFFDRNREKLYNLKNQMRLVINSSDNRGIWVGQKRYSGSINVLIDNQEIIAVNQLGVENYLSSVVGSEMPHKWPLEALKAQAIASRTYALKQKGNKLYDIDSTQKNQVYNGLESKTRKTRKAVRSTRSLVLTYKNKLINALFHSSSGGMTEYSQNVWRNKYPYLSSVKDFDRNNPKLKWQKKFSQKELNQIFPNIGGIKNINILNISQTGRVKNVILEGKYGSKEISGKDLRREMGLKSTLMRFKFIDTKSEKLNATKNSNNPSEKILLVSGLGAGHGVGMSQWGARYMAKRGQKAEVILKHFYKGVKIKPFKNIYK